MGNYLDDHKNVITCKKAEHQDFMFFLILILRERSLRIWGGIGNFRNEFIFSREPLPYNFFSSAGGQRFWYTEMEGLQSFNAQL